jgi:hypothetical protein
MTALEQCQRMVMCTYWKYLEEKTPETRKEWERVVGQYRRMKEAQLKEKTNDRSPERT